MRAEESDAGLNARAGMMPPVTTRQVARADLPADGERMAPPSVWQPAGALAPEPVLAPEPLQATTPAPAPEPSFDDFDEPWTLAAVTETESPPMPAVFDVPEPVAAEPAIVEGPVEDIGALIAETAVIEEEEDEGEEEEFPLDAVIAPEEREAWMEPPGEAVSAPPGTGAAVSQLAVRLAAISEQLRHGDAEAVIDELARGDRLDALLAGLLAGFLAGSGE